jgi:hypothetical protein
MSKPSKFVVYNANNPKKFAVILMNGLTFGTLQFNAAKLACGVGPFLGFFLEEPHITYRTHGPFCGRNEIRFYAVSNTGLVYDDVQERIVNGITHMIERKTKKGSKEGEAEK